MLKFLQRPRIAKLLSVLAAVVASLLHPQLKAADGATKKEKSVSQSTKAKPKLDRSDQTQTGEASIYSDKFHGKTMADGNKMDPNADNAASKTLPLGTRARVTNLETGESTVVTIQDRGPHVKGRIIDLPPGKAGEIGLTMEEGVAKVKVEPVKLPNPDAK